MFRVQSVEGNTQRLDGGAMFGNCPKAVWQKWAPPDELNRITLACRGLLIRDAERTVLLEAGIGAFFEPKLRDRYGVLEPEHVLLHSLQARGVSPAQVDAVVLSHLHFDHAGGLLSPWKADAPLRLVFPNARILVGREAWNRACEPHFRDRASFVPELQELIRDSGRLELIDTRSEFLPHEIYSFSFSEGHTPGLMLTRVQTPWGPITFMGDLVPGVPWVHLPITMGYDRYPERLIEEKQAMLDRVRSENGWAFFTHDPISSACRITRDEKGRYSASETQTSLDWSQD